MMFHILLGHPILLSVRRTYEYKFMLTSFQKKKLRFEMYKEMPFFPHAFIQEFETLWNIHLE